MHTFFILYKLKHFEKLSLDTYIKINTYSTYNDKQGF